MMNCTSIKRLIDEAEHVDALPFEAANHVTGCAPCRRFADERAGLRHLLRDIPRVNAPMNFDAQLKARLAEAKAKPAFGWLNPTLYFRLGTASAALCVAIFALQYSGVISLTNTTASDERNSPIAAAPLLTPPPPVNDEANPTAPIETAKLTPNPAAQPAALNATVTPTQKVVAYANRNRVQANSSRGTDEYAMSGMPRVFIRNNRGQEIELPMQPVSVGAQSQLMRRAARSSASPVVMQPVSF